MEESTPRVGLVAAFVLLFISVFVPGHAALADAGFLTDGTQLISNDDFVDAYSSWRIDTSEPGAAAVESIISDFVGPTDTGLGEDAGAWTEVHSGDTDDATRNIPFGFSTSFNGETYDDVNMGSNTYVTFGNGSSRYSDLNFDAPELPGLHVCSDDHSFQRILSLSGEGTIRIRYEGTDSTSGIMDSPTIVYEVVFYEGQSYFDIHIGINDGCSEGGLPPDFRGHSFVGETLVGSAGTWPLSEDRTLTYQWQRYDSEAEEWVDISGATNLNYILTADDVDTSVHLTVTSTIDGDEMTAESNDTENVTFYHEITTCEELASMSDMGLWLEGYRLMNDIDCAETAVSPLWDDEFFEGVFDGQGYTISNLTIIQETDNVGLFASVSGATIKNVTFDAATIEGDSNVGVVIGYIDNDWVHMSNVHVINSMVTGHVSFTGGLVGQCAVDGQSASFVNVSFEGGTISNVEGYAGGIVGYLESSRDQVTLSQAVFNGTISSNDGDVGGLIGYLGSYGGTLTVENSYTSGSIDADSYNVGGLIGDLYISADTFTPVISIDNAYAQMDTMHGEGNVGGLIGVVQGTPSINGHYTLDITHTYATGELNFNDTAGGLIGATDALYNNDMINLVSNFSAVTFVPLDEIVTYGNLVGSYGYDEIDINVIDFYVDDFLADGSWCVGNLEVLFCTAVNVDNEDPNYFFDSENAPFYESDDPWDTDDTWFFSAELDQYPRLQFFSRPVVDTRVATEVSATTAFLAGVVSSDPLESAVERGMEYGTTREYGSFVSEFDGDPEDLLGEYSFTVDDLDCGTSYYFRSFVDSSELGTGYGDTYTLTTDACPARRHRGGGGYIAPDHETTSTTSESTSSDDADSTTDDASEDSDTTVDASDDELPENVSSHATSSFNDFSGHEEAEDTDLTGPSPYDGDTEHISMVAPGWYIRGENYETVYYVSADGHRHAFWDTQTFFTYVDDWDSVIWVTDATLATLPLGMPMLPNSGVSLVKVMSDAAVYAVEDGEVLRSLPDEATAITLYGTGWADYVIDIDPTMFHYFTIGSDMTSSDDVDRSVMKTRAQNAQQRG